MSNTIPQGATSDIERLMEHSPWLSGLARRLVADASTAEDLVQDTFVAAMESDAVGNVQHDHGWLAVILRRKAVDEVRSGSRRRWHECAAARPEARPGQDELAAAMESEGLLREALDALREPYRRTVQLRYREGRMPAEIAKEATERRNSSPSTTASVKASSPGPRSWSTSSRAG